MKLNPVVLLLWIFYPTFLLCRSEVNQKTLRAVQIAFRHGDRGPVDSPKTVESPLTNLGKNQMHDLGIYCRQRYPNLVKNTFDASEIFFLSSDRSRTLESTFLFAHGFYKGSNLKNNWSNGTLPYDPIPVKSIPAKYDVFFLRSKVCPRYEELMTISRKKFLKKFRERNPELIDDYEKYTGNPFNGSSGDISNEIGTFQVLQDEVFINISHNLPIQDWIQEYTNNIDFISSRLLMEKAHLETDEMIRLYAGPLAKLILENFEGLEKKMVVYGGHDNNLHSLLEVFGIWNNNNIVMPPIASVLLIELHQNEHEEYLEFWYRNDTKLDPMLLDVPDCGKQCKLTKLQSLMAKFIPQDLMSECRLDETLSNDS